MIETYYAGSYWLARPEAAPSCAQRAERFFHLLGHCDPAWTRWCEKADSFEEARQRQFTTDAANFQKLFAQRENRVSSGFSFHLWTGENLEETSVVDGSCGHPSPHFPSVCVLKPYEEGRLGERVLTAPVLTEVLRTMALAWDPEWGVATSEAHRQMAVKGFPDPGTFVGWVMYFSRLRGTVPPLPAPVRIEPVEDKGTLVILTPERFTASNPEHVTLAARVHELLDRAGLLRPLQPWQAG
ncbi:immunity 52 family protein [Hyalangium rubrum]|uniref:Immunity 52 family protein n=1 Tax=Hyalangium rubrum TaxID=3103134 RepID=A0ABU5H1N4_9BACT|nr:immunity 52 family protein [Hyalangium sp. s54d21]MDY7226692.1 immunity 52 family protein [Hyalangium sp. s54d21]